MITSPIPYEPISRRMFLVELPEEFKIPVWQINELAMPEFTNCGCYFSNGKWSDLEIKFIEVVKNSVYINLLANRKKRKFDITIKELDKTGGILNMFLLKIEYVKSIERDSFHYEADDILKTVARFKVKAVIPQ